MPVVRGVQQVARHVVVDSRHDDQDAIGTPGASFGHLIGLVQEILAQCRHLSGCPRLLEKFGSALKAGAVGQHREAGCTSSLIGLGDAGRVKVCADHAPGRAGLLDFGDQAIVAGGAPCFDRTAKAAWCRLIVCFGHDFGPWARGFGSGDFLALIGFNLLENIGHWSRPFDIATRRAKVCRARPSSMTAAARAMPSSIEVTRSATRRAAPAFSNTVSR